LTRLAATLTGSIAKAACLLAWCRRAGRWPTIVLEAGLASLGLRHAHRTLDARQAR
jgi:hypothetical protein